LEFAPVPAWYQMDNSGVLGVMNNVEYIFVLKMFDGSG